MYKYLSLSLCPHQLLEKDLVLEEVTAVDSLNICIYVRICIYLSPPQTCI